MHPNPAANVDDTFAVIAEWRQRFRTVDGIHARPDSAETPPGHLSEITVRAQADPRLVLITERFDGGYRRLIAERVMVLPMADALASGRLPYRFIEPDQEPAVTLTQLLPGFTETGDLHRWGPQILQLTDTVVRRLRSVITGDLVHVIAETPGTPAAVYVGVWADLSRVGLLRYTDVLVPLR